MTSAIYLVLSILLNYKPLPSLVPPSLTRSIITVHNGILLLSSLYMFLLLLPTLPSLSTLTCYPPTESRSGPFWYVAYLYYLSKYYELLDTLLQFLLSRSPRNFPLHVYHHTSAIIMAWR